MNKLTSKQINQLLALIKHPEDKKLVKKFLQGLNNSDSAKPEGDLTENSKRSTAKKVLDILSRVGLEIVKHKIIDSGFDLLD